MNEEYAAEEKIEWLAPQYEHKIQSVDWFWALGIIVVATAIASVIYENYFFAMVIVLGGIMLAYFTIKKPDMVDYELTEVGFRMKNRFYLYEEIKGFWVQKGERNPKGKDLPPMLFIKTARFFMPIVPVPIYPNIAEKLRNKMLSKNVAEEKMEEHPSLAIMEFLGF